MVGFPILTWRECNEINLSEVLKSIAEFAGQSGSKNRIKQIEKFRFPSILLEIVGSVFIQVRVDAHACTPPTHQRSSSQDVV